MTDADAMSELVRVGLRNPARVVVKVQTKKRGSGNQEHSRKASVIEEQRIPAKYVINYKFTVPPSNQAIVEACKTSISHAVHL